ncbi:hypothetical protein RJ641_014367, partial [Dillenia turbinata]
ENMFGGDNTNPVFPVYLEENRFQFDANSLPQLQLFGDYPVGCGVDPLNYVGSEHINVVNRPAKRGRETKSVSRPQKLHMSLNNFCQDEAGHSGSVLNPNQVSTGLRLSYEEDEHNSSVTTASESMSAVLPVIFSLGDNLKTEIDQQKEEFDQYIRVQDLGYWDAVPGCKVDSLYLGGATLRQVLWNPNSRRLENPMLEEFASSNSATFKQEQNLLKGVRELRQRHTLSFLSALENGVGRKLREKELEIENMNRKNKELVERIKQVAVEAQSWHYRAKYNKSVVSVLKNNLEQVMQQGAAQGKEGCGDNEVDDAASYTNQNHLAFVGGSGNATPMMQMTCRACRSKEVSILLLPCRHLCLCKDCEGFIDICPVCRVMKTASVQVYMS